MTLTITKKAFFKSYLYLCGGNNYNIMIKIIFMKKLLAILLLTGLCTLAANAQNPYMPLWEYIPDGEPYVFEDPDCPGKYRVYVYGSHDTLIKGYCGLEQVVWSAPVDALSQWRYDGIIFRNTRDANGNLLNPDGKGDLLYAPDIAVKTGTDGKKEYYLFPNIQGQERAGLIAKSNRPDGPYLVCNYSKTNPRGTDGILRADPAVFVDDDGRVYGYWGFKQSYGAELDPTTMSTVKPGTKIVTDMVTNLNQDGIFRFYEASSMRKIKDKYVFIYSRWTKDGEYGLPDSNYTLAYAYSDNPLGPFTYGGTIIDGRGRDTDDNGKAVYTAHITGNTHGSICEINGQWWVFYHRQTGLDAYSRQAMVAPIKVEVQKGKGGKVTISEGEYTSEGFQTKGLNPLVRTAAGTACYYTHPKGMGLKYPKYMPNGSYIEASRIDWNDYTGPYNLKQPLCPVVNNTNGSIVGYKYFNFDCMKNAHKVSLHMNIASSGVAGTITVMVGGPSAVKGGKVVGTYNLNTAPALPMHEITIPLTGMSKFKGKQSLYFHFSSPADDESLCTIYDFIFEKE